MSTDDAYLRPDLARAALISIDMQRDFLADGAAPIAGTSEVLPRVGAVLDWFRMAGRPIVHVVRLYRLDASNVDLCRRALIESGRAIVLPGTAGAELAPALQPPGAPGLAAEILLAGQLQALAPGEWAMYKPRWGAFYQTNLEGHLRSLDVTTLVFVGCNFPNCPRTSIYEASERDFRIVVVGDAISGIYERGVRELENIGVAVMTSSAFSSAVPSL